jgi:hypothetical protein
MALELMRAAEEEIGAAVTEAYAEGYKAATLEYAPEAAAYRMLADDMQATLESARKQARRFWPTVGLSAGFSFAAGFLCSFFIMGR